MEWGMSEKLGRVRYQSNEQEVFLGHSVAPVSYTHLDVYKRQTLYFGYSKQGKCN